MKTCPKCSAQVPDENVFCHVCGTNVDNPNAVYVPEWDHTAEFDAEDISKNKAIAMLMYLAGIPATIVFVAILWLLGDSKSPYATFHARQNIALGVVETLLALVTIILCWTIIVPIAALICLVILLVVRIICFISVCKNEAKEPAIIRSFGFLK